MLQFQRVQYAPPLHQRGEACLPDTVRNQSILRPSQRAELQRDSQASAPRCVDPTLSLFDVNDHKHDFNHHKRNKHFYDNYDNWWDIVDAFYYYREHKHSTYD